jgi:competence protein ComEA
MGLSRSEQIVLVLLSIAILAGRTARRGCGERHEFQVIREVASEDSTRERNAAGQSEDSSGVREATVDSTNAASGASSDGAREPPRTPQATGPIDLNRATLEELVTLPGIGPAKAKAILERREAVNGFRSIDDLLDVPGIGPKTLERLAGLVRVNAAPEEKR